MQRENSIDALRGLAIFGMVLSGSILHGLPGWMYHAQVGPPDFQFNPDIPGITWVDLVFPFFLFAMGLAFPFSLGRNIEKGISRKTLVKKVVARALKLAFFAIALAHLSPLHYPGEIGWPKWLIALLAFGSFFMAFCRFPQLTHRQTSRLNTLGYFFMAALIAFRSLAFDIPFAAHRQDIIILVLANMAVFGAIIWIYTPRHWLARLSVLPLFFGLRLTHDVEGSWNQAFWDFRPLQWIGQQWGWLHEQLLAVGVDTTKTVFYQADFLKYFFIVIPGSIVGDLLYRYFNKKGSGNKEFTRARRYVTAAAVILALVVFNLAGWYARYPVFTLAVNLAASLGLYLLLKPRSDDFSKALFAIALWSIFWLLLGTVFEAYEGGIKKDPATMSYFFLTSGLSGLMIIFFKVLYDYFSHTRIIEPLVSIGKNPMVGYVASSFVIMPLFYFLQVREFLNTMNEYGQWFGLLRGLIVTTLMMLLVHITVRHRYFWKT
jgi:predicted acyltransferase